MVRHIARALVHQAEGENQCDSIPVQVLPQDCEKNVRQTLTGFSSSLLDSKGGQAMYQVLRCKRSLQNCTFSFLQDTSF